MKLCYLLSNRQRKALLVQGQPVELVIPVAPIEIDDLVDWAKSVLPSDLRQYVTEAQEDEIRVVRDPSRTRFENLTDLLGEIADDEDRGWTVAMSIVRLILSPPNARHTKLSAQWPANVTIDGSYLIRATG